MCSVSLQERGVPEGVTVPSLPPIPGSAPAGSPGLAGSFWDGRVDPAPGAPPWGAPLSHTRPHRDPRQPRVVAQDTRLGEVMLCQRWPWLAPSAANTLQDRMFLRGKLPTASPGRLSS